MKVVINRCYGGMGISRAAAEHMGIRYDGDDYGLKDHMILDDNIERHDPRLVKAVEDLGSEAASGKLAKLAIEELPDDVIYEIDNHDGMESIASYRYPEDL